MRAVIACAWIAATGALLACSGCGFKGPLYLPERNATVVTHPAPAGTARKKQNPPPQSPPTTPPPRAR